jgi:hypothetical protein
MTKGFTAVSRIAGLHPGLARGVAGNRRQVGIERDTRLAWVMPS